MADSKFSKDMKSKIEEVAALDGSVEEMAMYCDVSRQTIYNWFKENEDFFDRIERLRQRPILKARKAVNEKMADNYGNAMDYLKRKKKKEFGDTQSIEITTPKPLLDVLYNDSDKKDSQANQET